MRISAVMEGGILKGEKRAPPYDDESEADFMIMRRDTYSYDSIKIFSKQERRAKYLSLTL